VSLGNVGLIRLLDPATTNQHVPFAVKILLTLIVKACMGLSSEWKFLPDVVLATVSVDVSSIDDERTNGIDSSAGEPCESATEDQSQSFERRAEVASASMGLQYGSLVSCIDFGGQLGAMLCGPLVAMVGTSRDNDWAHLDWLQEISSLLMLGSIVLLMIIK